MQLTEAVAYVLCYEILFGQSFKPMGPAERCMYNAKVFLSVRDNPQCKPGQLDISCCSCAANVLDVTCVLDICSMGPIFSCLGELGAGRPERTTSAAGSKIESEGALLGPTLLFYKGH
jgi:hypothetical protein